MRGFRRSSTSRNGKRGSGPGPADFLDDENWHGGYYELAIDLGASDDPDADRRLLRALSTVWSTPALDGCYMDRHQPPAAQARINPADIGTDEPPPMYGLATLPGGQSIVCATHVIREIEAQDRPRHDWLDLCLPLGALGRIDTRVGGYPFGDEPSLEWRATIDEWLFGIADEVFKVTTFRVGLIGFEVSGDPAADDLSKAAAAERWFGFALPREDGLRFIKPTK